MYDFPRPLLEPPLYLLKNAGVSKGFGRILGLAEFCREKGEEREFEMRVENNAKILKLSWLKAKILNK